MTGRSPAEIPIEELRFAVFDIETTGFKGGAEAMVEIAIAHTGLEEEPALAVDTLLKPRTRIGNRAIHGITNRDVRKAPKFTDVAGLVFDAFVDRVPVAHNAGFDLRFLSDGLSAAGIDRELAALCTMELHRVLSPASKSDLETACAAMDVAPPAQAHLASHDAVATARLLRAQLAALLGRGLTTLGDFRSVLMDRQAAALERPLLRASELRGLSRRGPLLPRRTGRAPARSKPVGPTYREELEQALRTRRVEPELRQRANDMKPSELASEHASVLAKLLFDASQSGPVTARGAERITEAMELLGSLGWAPGEPVAEG